MVKGIVVMEKFVMVDAPTHYNLILGIPCINKMNTIPSSYHQVIKYPTKDGVVKIWGDQEKARSCYNVALKQVNIK